MCVLSIAKPGIIHDRDDLEAACFNNPDGFGYAIHTGRHILRRRSMDESSIIDRYLEDRKRYLTGPAMFHARIATSGNVDNSGCHPFLLPGNSKVAIGHNGILPVDTKLTGWKSDTRFFVEDILTKEGGMQALQQTGFLADVEKWMGANNKIAILSADRRLPPYIILNEKAGHWDSGIWWSNYSYSYWKGSSYTSTSSTYRSVVTYTKGADGTYRPSTTDNDDSLWSDVECEWCSGILSEEMMDDGQCGHCWADIMDDAEWWKRNDPESADDSTSTESDSADGADSTDGFQWESVEGGIY